MRLLKIITFTFFIIICALPLMAQEYDKHEIITDASLTFNHDLQDNEVTSVFTLDRQFIEKELVQYKIANINNYWELYKVTKKNKTKKITLSSMKIAAISLLSVGIFFLLSGGGLLAGSLAYADYSEKNESDYDKYIAGKNLARGLFYGSMAGFGVGVICIAISIPLFIDYKPKATKKKKK